MARYDVYRRKGEQGYLLDCQADLLADLRSRLVVPLLPIASAPPPLSRLNPLFAVEGEQVMMATQFAAAVHVSELGDPAGTLKHEADAIGNALDMLLVGF